MCYYYVVITSGLVSVRTDIESNSQSSNDSDSAKTVAIIGGVVAVVLIIAVTTMIIVVVVACVLRNKQTKFEPNQIRYGFTIII